MVNTRPKCGLEQTQIVIFTPGFVMTDRLDLARNLGQAIEKAFDGDTAVLPLPEDAPLDVPRIILKAKDGSLFLKIAPARVDLHLSGPRAEAAGLTPHVPFETTGRILSLLREAGVAKITREALVTAWGIELRSPGADYIVERYLRSGMVKNRPAAAEVHLLHREEIQHIPSNAWIRIRSAHRAKEAGANNYLLVQVDLNSSADVCQSFDLESTRSFLTAAAERTNTLLCRYIMEL